MEQKPTVGRIIHYVHEGRHLAGIIDDVSEGKIGVTLFPGGFSVDGGWTDHVTVSPEAYSNSGENKTWHWPERE